MLSVYLRWAATSECFPGSYYAVLSWMSVWSHQSFWKSHDLPGPRIVPLMAENGFVWRDYWVFEKRSFLNELEICLLSENMSKILRKKILALIQNLKQKEKREVLSKCSGNQLSWSLFLDCVPPDHLSFVLLKQICVHAHLINSLCIQPQGASETGHH